MAIATEARKAGPFYGNDATTVFPFAFKVFTAEDLLVVRADPFGIEHELLLHADYDVGLNEDQDNDPGGAVTLLGGALAENYTLTLTSDVEALQPLALTNNGGFYPRVINDAFDRITIIAQQILEGLGRSIKLPISSTASATLSAPTPNAVLGWDSTGTTLVNIDPADLATVSGYADSRVEVFTGDGVQVQFALGFSPGVIGNLDVAVGGVTQTNGVDFTFVTDQLIFTSPPPNGAVILVRYARPITPLPDIDALFQAAEDAQAAADSVMSMSGKLEHIIDVTQPPYNAVGDGVADDTDAFEAAFLDARGAKVYAPGGVYRWTRRIDVLPVPWIDVEGEGLRSTGAFAPGIYLAGDGLDTIIDLDIPNDAGLWLNVTLPANGNFRAQMFTKIERLVFRGTGQPGTVALKVFNSYQLQLSQLSFRNLGGTAIQFVNGLEGNVPDSGWNCANFENMWIENCALDGHGFGIDATGVEGRNEGSFTHMKNVFIQGCGKNQYFTVTGVSTANPAIVSLNLNQRPAVSPVATAHPFALGDRVKGFGIRKTQALGANPITTAANSPVVTIALAAHGLAVGDNVGISGAAAVNGITLSGEYQVTSVPATGTFTVVHTSAANAAGAGGGGAVVLKSPMKAVTDTVFYSGPGGSANTIALHQASGAAMSLVANPIEVTNGSFTARVTRAAHGLAPGDLVVFSNAFAVNGLLLDKGYSVVSTPDANTFTVTAATAATADGVGGGTTIKVQKIVSFDGAAIGTWVDEATAPVTIDNNPILTTAPGDPNIPATTVVITDSAHGAAVGDLVTISGAPAVGGITLSGQYRITALGDNAGANTANKYRITHSVAATSTVQGGGAGVQAAYTLKQEVLGEIGFYEPQSGGMRYKGQLLKRESCGFTINQNCADFVKGGAGGAIGIINDQVTWENSYRRHFFAKGGINYFFIGSQTHGNQLFGLGQWRLFEFDTSENVVQQVVFQNTKIRAKECPAVAFKMAGAQGDPRTMRVNGTLWADFDYQRQVRFLGVRQTHVPQNLILYWTSATLMSLRPDPFAPKGMTGPIRLRGPNNDSGTGVPSMTGEVAEWEPSAVAGAHCWNTLTGQSGGGALANDTDYQIYAYDNDGVVALVPSLDPWVLDPVLGLPVRYGDPSMIHVGVARTDGAGQWSAADCGHTNPVRIEGGQKGQGAWLWWSTTKGGRLWWKAGTRPTSVDGGTASLRPVFTFAQATDLASIAAGASATFSITAANTVVGDGVFDVTSSTTTAGDQALVLSGRVTAAGTVTGRAINPTGAAIDPANATYTAHVVRVP